MYNARKINPMPDEENKIRMQIDDLKKQLPKRKATKKKLPDFPTYEEYIKYINHLSKGKGIKVNKQRLKQYLLATILAYEAGMRISEIIGLSNHIPKLTKDRIDMEGNTIRILSAKGGKDRIVPLPPRFNKKTFDMLPLDIGRRALQWFTSKETKKVLGRALSFHKFRHGFGSRLANQGVPLHQIQMWMGHSRLDVTGIYLHASPSQDNINKVRDLF